MASCPPFEKAPAAAERAGALPDFEETDPVSAAQGRIAAALDPWDSSPLAAAPGRSSALDHFQVVDAGTTDTGSSAAVLGLAGSAASPQTYYEHNNAKGRGLYAALPQPQARPCQNAAQM